MQIDIRCHGCGQIVSFPNVFVWGARIYCCYRCEENHRREISENPQSAQKLEHNLPAHKQGASATDKHSQKVETAHINGLFI